MYLSVYGLGAHVRWYMEECVRDGNIIYPKEVWILVNRKLSYECTAMFHCVKHAY